MSMIPTFETLEKRIASTDFSLEEIFESLGEPPELINSFRSGITIMSVTFLEEIEQVVGFRFDGPVADSSAVLGRLKRDIIANGPFVNAWVFYEEIDGYLHFTDYAIPEPGMQLSSLGRPEHERAKETDLGEVLRWLSKQDYDPSQFEL